MGAPVKLWTFNLGTGVDPGRHAWVDRGLRLHVEELNERQPDIVCFQEVDRDTGRSADSAGRRRDQVEILRNSTHLKHAVYAGIDYDGGQYGDAILSRWPAIGASSLVADSALPMPFPGYRHNAVKISVPCARFLIYGVQVRVRSVHYPGDGQDVFGPKSPNSFHHQKSAGNALLHSLRPPFSLPTLGGNAIIGGDFNSNPADPGMRPLITDGFRVANDPGRDHDPLHQNADGQCGTCCPGIDYVLYRGEDLRVLSSWTFDCLRGGGWGTGLQFTDHPIVETVFAVAPEIEQRFRDVNDWKNRTQAAFGAAWPTMNWRISEPNWVYDVVLMRPEHLVARDVPAAEQPAHDNRTRFTAAHDYARHHGFEHGFPNFHQADHGRGTVFGTFLVPQGSAAAIRDVPVAQLGLPDPPFDTRMERWFQGAAAYAKLHGFEAGMPTGHSTDYGDGHVCGVHLYRKNVAELRSVIDLY